MNFLDEPHFVYDLLPHSPKMRIKELFEVLAILRSLRFILNFANQTLSDLLQGHFDRFDPLVGENSCQIRGYFLYYLWHHHKEITSTDDISSLTINITSTIERINQIELQINTNKKDMAHNHFPCKHGISVPDFFDANKINLLFKTKIIMLLMSYILARYTIYNEYGIHTGINYTAFCLDNSFSKTQARRFVHLYQTQMARFSCAFVKFLANEMIAHFPHYVSVLDQLTRVDDEGRKTLPCFLSMSIILNHMMLTEAKILITIYQHERRHTTESLIYNSCYSISGNHQRIAWSDISDKSLPCIVFRSVSKLNVLKNKKTIELFSKNLIHCILASTAMHPQYPGKKLLDWKENPFAVTLLNYHDKKNIGDMQRIQDEFLLTKQWALQNGCSITSPDIFFVTHIFCDKISKYCPMVYH